MAAAGGASAVRQKPCNHGCLFFHSAALHFHGTYASIYPAAAILFGYGQESAELCFGAADPYRADLDLRLPVLCGWDPFPSEGKPQHGFPGGHRYGKRIYLQLSDDLGNPGRPYEGASAVL